jgi:CRP-like cAMP-binding protein
MIRTNQALLSFIEQLPGIQLQEYPAGHKLFRQDQKALHVYFLKSGIAKCYITENNGKDFILEFFGEGEVMGELEILRNSPVLSTVEAVTSLHVFKLDSGSFLHLLDTNKTFNRIIMEELATRVVHAAVRASYQQLYPVEYNLLKLLSLFTFQELPLSKQDLADYLAVSVRSLNRTLKQLRDNQFMPVDGYGLQITAADLQKVLTRFDD